MSGLRLALHWSSLGPDADLDVLCGAASGAGFAGIEARWGQLEPVARRGTSRLARLLALPGLCQVAVRLQAPLDAPPAEFDAELRALEATRTLIRGLTSFGVGQALAVVADAASPEGAGLDRLRALADVAAEAGVAVLLDRRDGAEPAEAETRERFARIAAAARPNLGVVCGRVPGRDWAALREIPLHCRLDLPAGRPPGPEAVALFRGLRAMDYDGYVSVGLPLPVPAPKAGGPASVSPPPPDPQPGTVARRLRQAVDRLVAAAARPMG